MLLLTLISQSREEVLQRREEVSLWWNLEDTNQRSLEMNTARVRRSGETLARKV